MKAKAAIILDNMSISKWKADALCEAADVLDIKLVLNCKNTQSKKDLVKNFFYYVLNILSLRNNLTKNSAYELQQERFVDFDSIYEGMWQKLPQDVLQAIADEEISVIIKFGMNLLRIGDELDQYNVLSFHHGDPSKYRGRPAGFYEILNGEKKTGIIVQKLSNKLDAGDIYAFAESKVVNYSYKKTAINFYSTSKYLLRKALLNLQNDKPLEVATNGKNYRLPSNLTAVRFIVLLMKNYMKRICYGTFFEKKWKTSITDDDLNFEAENLIGVYKLKNLPISEGYNFYADPFYSIDGNKIRLEALDKKTGLGDILEISTDDLKQQKVILTGKHYSYPFSFIGSDVEYLLPEVASHSPQYIFPIEGGQELKTILNGLESKRMVDATLFNHDGFWFLFYGENTDADSVLHLWYANDLEDEFQCHPCSPICMNPSSSRMGGRIMFRSKMLYRLGQNNEGGYGESLTIAKITNLSPTDYEECICGSVKMDFAKGPHSIDINQKTGELLLDYYSDEFSVLAGIRRLKARLAKN